MTVNELLELTRAGFSKQEIIKLAGIDSASPSSSAAPEKAPEAAPAAPAAAPEAKEEPKQEQDISAIIEREISKAFKPFETLYNNIAEKANMPSIGDIEPKGIDDIINDFFTK